MVPAWALLQLVTPGKGWEAGHCDEKGNGRVWSGKRSVQTPKMVADVLADWWGTESSGPVVLGLWHPGEVRWRCSRTGVGVTCDGGFISSRAER